MPKWKSDGTGVQPGGDCGGDYQSTESFSVRYIRADQTSPPFSLITVYFYGEDPKQDGRHVITMQNEYMTCLDLRDPGSSERWADARYITVDHGPYASAADAESRARTLAQRHRAGDISWDGRPWR